MAITTAAQIAGYRSGKYALALVFEGYDLAFTDTHASAMATAWSATDWATWKPGLMAESIGGIRQQIELFSSAIKADSVAFELLDTDDSLIALAMRNAYASGDLTHLTASLAPAATTATVLSTTDFDSSGHIYIGREAIAYTGKTATTFTGLTRGKWSVFGTNSTPTRYGHNHYISPKKDADNKTAPAVSSYPRAGIVGRGMALYLHHMQDDGTWCTKANARLLWAGYGENCEDLGDHRLRIRAREIRSSLQKSVAVTNYSAEVPQGMHITDALSGFQLEGYESGIATYNTATSGMPNLTTGRKTHEDVADNVRSLMQSLRSANADGDVIDSDHTWSIELRTDQATGGQKYVIRCRTTGTFQHSTGDDIYIALSSLVWDLLGFGQQGGTAHSVNGYTLRRRELQFTEGGDVAELVADKPPLLWWQPWSAGDGTFLVTNEAGAWANQPSDTLDLGEIPSGFEGFIRLGELILAVSYDSSVFTVYGYLHTGSRHAAFVPTTTGVPGAFEVRLGDADADSPPTVQQVWFERGLAGTILLRLMLSTGGPSASAYNDATYDLYRADGFGLAIPYGAVDIESFVSLNEFSIQLLIDKPTPFSELLEQVCDVGGRHVVWRSRTSTTDPKITVVHPGAENAYLAVTHSLDETNKADTSPENPDRVRDSRGVDEIINRMVIEYGADLSGKNAHKFTVTDEASQSDFGKRRTVTIKAPAVLDVEQGPGPQLAATALAYFSRPLAITERSIDASLFDLAPGDAVLLSDEYMVDPTTGTRGVTNLPCWVLGVTFDPYLLKGTVQLVFTPENDPDRKGVWAPSAMVDETVSGGGYTAGYNSGTKTLAFHENTFSYATDPQGPTGNDVARFAAGDKVHIYEYDAPGGTEWTDTIASLDSGATPPTVTLTTGLAGFASERLVMEYDAYDQVVAAQKQKTFIGDASSGLVDTGVPAYQFGIDPSYVYLTATRPYTHGFCRLLGNNEYTTPYPLSVGDFWMLQDGLNNFLAYKSRTNMGSSFSAVTRTAATPVLAYIMFVPLYGHVSLGGIRRLGVRVHGNSGHASKAMTVTIKACGFPVGGASFTAPVYTGNVNTETLTIAGSSNAWSDEGAIDPVPSAQGGMWGTWITAEIQGEDGAHTVSLDGIAIYEAPL